MKDYVVIILLLLLITASCKQPAPLETDNTYTAGIPAGARITVPEGFSEEGIDQLTLQMILRDADHIDYMFNTLPLSMNQDGSQLVFQDLSFLSNQPIKGLPTTCQPLARKIYMGKGDIIIEADIYFDDLCVFQVFIKDEKPLFGNLLTLEGISFYNNLLEETNRTMPDDVRNSL